jgi:hypothetical protein
MHRLMTAVLVGAAFAAALGAFEAFASDVKGPTRKSGPPQKSEPTQKSGAAPTSGPAQTPVPAPTPAPAQKSAPAKSDSTAVKSTFAPLQQRLTEPQQATGAKYGTEGIGTSARQQDKPSRKKLP